MSSLNKSRLVRTNQTVVDQIDFFAVDGFNRQAGLTIIDLATRVFCDNAVQPWVLVNGAAVPDALVKSGSLYFHEITGADGYYSLRFRPTAVGYWRIVVTYTAGQQIAAQDYDVAAESPQLNGGLVASFTPR